MRMAALLGFVCVVVLGCGGGNSSQGGTGGLGTGLEATSSMTDSGGSGGGTAAEADLPPVFACAPTAGGPYWLLEGETVEFEVVCSTGLAVAGSGFEFSNLPQGAQYDPDTSRVRWTPTLSQAAVYTLGFTATQYEETGEVRVGVADAFLEPDNVPVVDPAAYTHEYGLPVLHLSNSDLLTNDFYTPATIIYAGHSYSAESKLRGASSLAYPKNNYTLKFAKEDKFSEPEREGGFLEKRKLVLTSTFDDNSYIRQRLAFEMWNRLDPAHIQVQAYNLIVFLDGAYHGLYMVGDHIDGYLMEDHGMWQDGNLYKARTHDANFSNMRFEGGPKSNIHEGLTKSEGFPIDGQPGAFDDLDELIDFVANSNDTDFVAELDARIERRDYENWFIFVTVIAAGDSAGKNSYHYHDPAVGKWRYVPWDFNHSFGQDWRTRRVTPDEWPEGYLSRNELFTRILAHPTMGSALRERYGAALQAQYALEDVLALVDSWGDENLPSALRDESLWGEAYVAYDRWNTRKDLLDHAQELEYLKDWLTERWIYLDTQY